MNELDQIIEQTLDQIYGFTNTDETNQSLQQLKAYGKKYTIGAPSDQFRTNLEKLFPTNNPDVSEDYINFNQWIKYRNLKQNINIDNSSWTPDSFVFTNEGLGTPEYSAWKNEPLNTSTGSMRLARLSYVYNNRALPLRLSSGSYSTVDYFNAAFWASLISESGTIAENNAVSFLVPKSFFISCNYFDSQGRPLDIAIYTNDTLTSIFSGSWNPISISYYQPLTVCHFLITNYDNTYYQFTIDITGTNLITTQYKHFLFLTGCQYPIKNTGPLYNVTGSVTTKKSILKFISNQFQPAVNLPRVYDAKNITGIINQNTALTGISGSINSGDLIALINQNNTKQNGLYVASTGSWLSIDNDLTQFNFLQSTSQNITGSKVLYARNGICFDAMEPDSKILAKNTDNINPYWLYNDFNQQPISYISFTGSIYESFKLNNYAFDIININPLGSAQLDFSYTDVNLVFSRALITSQDKSIGRLNDQILIAGNIISATGTFDALTTNQTIYIISTPEDFAVAQVLYTSSNSIQLLIQEIFGSPSIDLKLYNNVIIFGQISEDSPYINLYEVYEAQLYKTTDYSNFILTAINQAQNINFANSVAKGSDGLEVKQSTYNPNAIVQLSKKYGRLSSVDNFQQFPYLSTQKPFSSIGMEGVIVEPVVNFLQDDLQFNEKIYEYSKQTAKITGKKNFIANSITNPNLAAQEFDFNYLNNQSIAGESSSFYSSPAPLFTGPNVILSTDSFAVRIQKIDTWGNKYVVSENNNVSFLFDTHANFTSINQNTAVLGAEILNNYHNFWDTFTGPYASGLYLTETFNILTYPQSPAQNITSTETINNIYVTTGSSSDLIFSGETIFIPIPATDYSGLLTNARIQMKVLGSDLVNGFLRAYIVDLNKFFKTNDTNYISILAASDNVSMNYLNSNYQDVFFSFKTDALFATRNNYGQYIYLAIIKVGDISKSVMSIKAVNNAQSLLYQTYSGSNLNSNVIYSQAVTQTTGSSIYSLYEYIGNPLNMKSRAVNPTTQSFNIIRFPFMDNPTNTSYNASSDYLSVTYNNLTGSVATLPNISLSSAFGIDNYSFTTPGSITGPNTFIILGASGPNVNQTPEGYHILISVDKQVIDGFKSALQELERNFVYDTLMLPELSLTISENYLAGIKNAAEDDASLINNAKFSIMNSNSLYQRNDFNSENRKYSYFIPRINPTGSIIYSGLRSNQIIDQVFNGVAGQEIYRTTLNSTAGLSSTIFEGTANGIPANLNDAVPLVSTALGTSEINAESLATGSLLLTVLYINFVAQGNEIGLRITVGPNSLWRIDNLTDNTTTSGIGPTGTYTDAFATGSLYNLVAYAFGPKAEQTDIKIECNTGSYAVFNLNDNLRFSGSVASTLIKHPYNLSLVDVFFKENNDVIYPLFRRYIR